jgi:hypothetical protein
MADCGRHVAPFGECFLLDLDPLLLKRRHVRRKMCASVLPKRKGALCAVGIGVQLSNVECWLMLLASGVFLVAQTVVVCVRGCWLDLRAWTRLSAAGPLEIDTSLRPLVPLPRSRWPSVLHQHQTLVQSP